MLFYAARILSWLEWYTSLLLVRKDVKWAYALECLFEQIPQDKSKCVCFFNDDEQKRVYSICIKTKFSFFFEIDSLIHLKSTQAVWFWSKLLNFLCFVLCQRFNGIIVVYELSLTVGVLFNHLRKLGFPLRTRVYYLRDITENKPG